MERTYEQLANNIRKVTASERDDNPTDYRSPFTDRLDAAYNENDFGCHTAIIGAMLRQLVLLMEKGDHKFTKKENIFKNYSNEARRPFTLIVAMECDEEFDEGELLLSHGHCGCLMRSNGEAGSSFEGAYRIASPEEVERFIVEMKEQTDSFSRWLNGATEPSDIPTLAPPPPPFPPHPKISVSPGSYASAIMQSQVPESEEEAPF